VADQALCFHSRTPEETRRIAAGLARAWRDTTEGAGLVVRLSGDLGAGKTVFVKGLADGLGLDGDAVSSPTFVLANAYPGPDGIALHHVDFYRIEEAAELEEMGFFDLIAPGAVLAVEWGERFDHALPTDRIEVEITRTGETERRLDVRARGPVAEAARAAWGTAGSSPGT
jgi:tRNA threonylcarbamoyladenosine biosynthesis protein TsaE